MTPPLLSVRDLSVGYGDVPVLHGVDLDLEAGAIGCVIGSNGAGKTTLMRALSGVLRPSSGTIEFAGERVEGQAPGAMLRRGLAHVPEGRRLFAGMSVRENLLMGAFLRRDTPAIRQDLAAVIAIFPRLGERLGQDAATLSGGEQQMCAIGRGLMARPRLLLVDELSLGLSPLLVEELAKALQRVNAQGTTILVVEQDVATALELAHSAVVLDTGRVVRAGPAGALALDPMVRQAYLGQVAPVQETIR